MTGQRTTREWQELDAAHHWHPFSDTKALNAEGSRVITRAAGQPYLGQRRQPHPRRHGRPVVRQYRLWPQGAGRGRLPADAGPRLLQLLLQDHAPGRRRACGAHRRGRSAAHEPGVLHRLGLGIERHRPAPGPPLLGRDGPARAADGDQPLERLSRQHHGRRQPRRHEADARPRRPADPGHRPHPPALLVRRGPRPGQGCVRPGLRPCAGGEDPGARARERRGVHRRAGPGSRRRDHPAATATGPRSSGSAASTTSSWSPTR